jgi:hypothetical protein
MIGSRRSKTVLLVTKDKEYWFSCLMLSQTQTKEYTVCGRGETVYTRWSGEELTLLGRFELLVLMSATDPVLSTQPSHVMPQIIFLFACMSHLKKRCKDLPILGIN